MPISSSIWLLLEAISSNGWVTGQKSPKKFKKTSKEETPHHLWLTSIGKHRDNIYVQFLHKVYQFCRIPIYNTLIQAHSNTSKEQWVMSRHTASPQLKTSRLGFKLPSPLSQNSSNTPSPSNLPKKLCPKFNPIRNIWDNLISRAITCVTAMHDDSDFKGSSGGLTIHNANCIEELKWGRKWNF